MATILVVDDRPSNRQYLTTLLSYSGHRLLEAGDGEEALRVLRAGRPDLVITDILMPTMDGFEFVKRLRADPDLAATPVVFHTATYSQPQAKQIAEVCGVRTVLPKPCDPEDVLHAVDAELGTGTAARRTLPAGNALGAAYRRYDEDLSELKARMGERLSVLLDAALATQAERDPGRIAQLFFDAATAAIPSEVAALGLLDEREHALRHLWCKGVPVTLLQGDAARHGLLGELLAKPQMRRAGALPAGHPPAGTLLAISVATPGRIHGWLYFARSESAPGFDAEDERIARLAAAQLALRYEHAQLFETVQRHAAALQVEASARRQAADALAQAERQYRLIFEHSVEGIFQTTLEGRVLAANPAAARMLGYGSPAEAIAHIQDLGSQLYSSTLDRERFLALLRERKEVHGYETQLRRRDGNVIWCMVSASLETDERDGTRFILGSIQDVSERHAQQERIERLSRMHAVLSGINALIVRATDRAGLLKDACRVAVDAGRFALAWAGDVDRASGSIRLGPWAGAGEGYVERMPLILLENGAVTPGLSALAVKEKRAMVANDIGNDPRIQLRGAAVARGFHSLAILPLLAGGEATAVLALYSDQAGFFDDAEMKLLNELSGDLSFALDNIARAERLNFLTLYDPLTGLANRALFLEHLGQRLHLAGDEEKLAVVQVDIERLRTVNESLGRAAGDALLQAIAGRLARGATRDELARLGADLFAVILGGVKGSSEATRRVERLWQDCFGEPYNLGEVELKVAARGGIALFPRDGRDPESLLHGAEAALRRAKDTGDRWLFHAADMTARTSERLALENDLRRALEREEFVLHYQPKVELTTRRIVGIEGLIRWQSAERGLVPPGSFIPLMEETGLILDVGAWALRRAVLDHRHWLRQGLQPPRIAVNVSPIQLRQRDFVERVQEAIALGANPPGIDLEITESLLMSDIEGNIRKLRALRDAGLRIAIDDFGTGYSSLGYLAKLPVHALKIDRSFVDGMLGDPDSMLLVSTMISLAHSLRLTVVAEGVENTEQAKTLRLVRCDEAQGYLFGPPARMEEITPLLRTGSVAD